MLDSKLLPRPPLGSGTENHGYQVLSNLFYKRDSCEATDNREEKGTDGNHPQIIDDKFANGCYEICCYLEEFDYLRIISRLNNPENILNIYKSSKNGYEKLQLFRLLEVGNVNSIIQKFINEAYHIENEYICQLDPSNFDTIPEYVIQECDSLVNMIFTDELP